MVLTQDLSSKYQDHDNFLSQANEKVDGLLCKIGDATESVSTFRESLTDQADVLGRWPLVAFPTAFLVLGSYGLAPSVMRNLGLMGLGALPPRMSWK
jgi:hypothetical protein